MRGTWGSLQDAGARYRLQTDGPVPVALAGRLPRPVATFPACPSSKVVVEIHRARDVDVEVRYDHHLISVLGAPLARLVQRRDGRSCERPMRAGDVVVTAAGTPKRWQHDEEASFFAVRMPPAFFDDIAAQAGDDATPRLLDHFALRDAHLERLVRRLAEELGSPSVGGAIYADAIAMQLAVHLLRHCCTRGGATETGATLPPRKLRRATEFIEEHLAEDLTLDRLAGVLAMSPYHFAHAFKRAVGVAPHQFVLKCRVDRAMIMLRDTDLPIGDVGSRVGMPNPSHFSVVFRRMTGVAPRRFRSGD